MYVVQGDELNRINRELYSLGLKLIAQIHSHPTEAYHSETDDAFPIVTILGGISVVVPDFGSRGIDLSTWEVYRLNNGPIWEHLSSLEKNKLLTIVDKEPRRRSHLFWPWN